MECTIGNRGTYNFWKIRRRNIKNMDATRRILDILLYIISDSYPCLYGDIFNSILLLESIPHLHCMVGIERIFVRKDVGYQKTKGRLKRYSFVQYSVCNQIHH